MFCKGFEYAVSVDALQQVRHSGSCCQNRIELNMPRLEGLDEGLDDLGRHDKKNGRGLCPQ